MSIERQYGESMLMCDECEDESESDRDFHEMLRQAKKDGWLITQKEDTDEWTHLCPDCVSKLPTIK